MGLRDVRLVVCDMDGTLLNANHEVSSRFYVLFEQLQGLGIHFAAASGRQHDSIRQKLAPIADKIYIIAENGAYASQAGEPFLLTTLPTEPSAQILTKMSSVKQANVVVCTPHEAYVLGKDQSFIGYMQEYYTSHRVVTDLIPLPKEAVKLAIHHPVSSEQFVWPLLSEGCEGLKVKVSGQHWVDVSHPEAHKGNALAVLQKRLGITAEQTMAFGDYLNDVELLQGAAYSYAMAEAHPDLAAVARYRAGSHTAEGVEDVLQELVKAHRPQDR